MADTEAASPAAPEVKPPAEESAEVTPPSDATVADETAERTQTTEAVGTPIGTAPTTTPPKAAPAKTDTVVNNVQPRVLQANNQVDDAQVFSLKDWKYHLSDKTIILDEYIGSAGDVVIKGHPDDPQFANYHVQIDKFTDELIGTGRQTLSILAATDGAKVIFNNQYLSFCEPVLYSGKRNVNYNSLTMMDLSGLDTSHVTDINGAFAGLNSIRSINVTGWDTSHVTKMNAVFYLTPSLCELDLKSWDTSNVTNMAIMFSGSRIRRLDLSNFDTHKVTNMKGMFAEYYDLESVDVSSFDVEQVRDVNFMFRNMPNLKEIDLSNFDIRNVREMNAFVYNSGVKEIDLSKVNRWGDIRFQLCMICNTPDLELLNLSKYALLGEEIILKVPKLRLVNFAQTRVNERGKPSLKDLFNNRTGAVAIVAPPELAAWLKSDDSGETNGPHWDDGEGTFVDSSKTLDLVKSQFIDPNNLYATLPTPEQLANLPVPTKPGWTFKGWKLLGKETNDIARLKIEGYMGNFMTGHYIAEYYQTDAQKYAANLHPTR
ncbi:BspA family leucine-rich repeat surface protein [Ligilactobacillus saerimneri]|uniref:BspA family leucine-rich repeat surface protein n=1 Tax=Ligilactobacillus saerimneri TaxID=228229 RepID=A0A7H9ELL4_9LACO|nr:BspA family leucine-rich repeat surface protein [Ligilactobacillus saerimneri]QLL78576.1 BspA family leucine-rich repeat surface protein [Ligilactobacillus saerimneri]